MKYNDNVCVLLYQEVNSNLSDDLFLFNWIHCFLVSVSFQLETSTHFAFDLNYSLDSKTSEKVFLEREDNYIY